MVLYAVMEHSVWLRIKDLHADVWKVQSEIHFLAVNVLLIYVLLKIHVKNPKYVLEVDVRNVAKELCAVWALTAIKLATNVCATTFSLEIRT